jgi:hypothetical protein
LADTGFILPLCTLDEVRAELADTERSIVRLGDFPVVNLDRRVERLSILNRWRTKLAAQVKAMETSGA